jgi:hypothetical protein
MMTPLIAKPPWTTEEEERLRQLAQSGKSAVEISKLLGRAEKATRYRLHKLGVSTKRITLRKTKK